MFKKIVIVLVVILAALAAFVATRPSDYRVVRSRTVAAPPEVVHAYVSDFHKWPEWSPWEKLDPAMKRDFSGAPSGTGAEYHWSGNSDVGEGQMTITDSGAGTNVTWAMDGHNNFMAKAFSAFMDMDKMIGADFEKGLAGLDAATVAARRQ